MSLIAVVSSPWWWVVCAIAWALIYWDVKYPAQRRIAAALVVALLLAMMGATLSASYYVPWEFCDDAPNWVYIAGLCWL